MSEIRLRQVPKELMLQAEKVRHHFKSATITGAFEKLIQQFFQDQETIKQLQEENKRVGLENQRYQTRESDGVTVFKNLKLILDQLSKHCNALDHDAAKLLDRFIARKKKRAVQLKLFAGTKKQPGKAAPARSRKPGKKIVPGKKGGKRK